MNDSPSIRRSTLAPVMAETKMSLTLARSSVDPVASENIRCNVRSGAKVDHAGSSKLQHTGHGLNGLFSLEAGHSHEGQVPSATCLALYSVAPA